MQIPALKHRFRLFFIALANDDEHALLRLRKHHFVRRHVSLAAGDLGDIELDARIPLAAASPPRAGDPRRPQVLHANYVVRLQQFKAGFDQAFLEKWVAHLHRRPLVGGLVGELARGEARAPVDAVPARVGADQ